MHIIRISKIAFVVCLAFVMFGFSACKESLTKPGEDLILGIYSETASNRLINDTDSFIGTYSGAGASFTEFVDDNSEVREGGISKRATMSVDGPNGQFAGWFIQWGKDGSPDSESRDMSAYEGGSLTFWVKSPINLLVGIRDGADSPGAETSTVILNNYSSFKPDGEWHKVGIPLSDFTGSGSKADLSKIKIFFNVASNTPSGGTGGQPQTFWIDDIRWEKTSE